MIKPPNRTFFLIIVVVPARNIYIYIFFVSPCTLVMWIIKARDSSKKLNCHNHQTSLYIMRVDFRKLHTKYFINSNPDIPVFFQLGYMRHIHTNSLSQTPGDFFSLKRAYQRARTGVGCISNDDKRAKSTK